MIFLLNFTLLSLQGEAFKLYYLYFVINFLWAYKFYTLNTEGLISQNIKKFVINPPIQPRVP